MTKEEIIEMAQEAGLVNWEATAYANELERFAALVASAEREACAKLCDEWQYMDGERLSIKIRARGQE